MKTELIAQYRCALKMLTETIEKCPDKLWEDDSYINVYWRIVYHALFYTAFYVSENDEKFIPWQKHQFNSNFLGSETFDKRPIVIETSYSKADLLAYADEINNSLERLVTKPENIPSGFFWLPMTKMELHLYNLRHLQHHTGQLVERLHQNGIMGIPWRGIDR